MSETATFAAGCFWGVEATFRQLPGVLATRVGYTGGKTTSPTYEDVCTDRTGHAEAVEVTYDPTKVSYDDLLNVFWENHDPTTPNRQGPDVGTQYRSAIFPANPEQARVAKAYIAQLNQARVFKAAIVTKIEPDRPFYAAEDYHQDFMTKHPAHPYIVYNDLPKIDDLKRLFAETYRAEPVLVAATARPTN
jgi:peptide-methionine (S)-S-oxide reductase